MDISENNAKHNRQNLRIKSRFYNILMDLTLAGEWLVFDFSLAEDI